MLRAIGVALSQSGFTPQTAKVLGTGLWDDPLTPGTPIAIGGWYAGVAPGLTAKFSKRYAATYGGTPPRLASLAYDATSLAISFAKQPRGSRFTPQQITNPQGFQGANGLFRFRANGLIERGLSILQMTASGPRVIAPAPGRFSFAY